MDNPKIFLSEARQAALEAGRYLLQGLNQKKEVAFKGQVDLVTSFDRKSEEMIYDRLSRASPTIVFRGRRVPPRQNL